MMLRATNFILFSLLIPSVVSAQQEDVRADAERMEQRIRELSQFGANPEGGWILAGQLPILEPDA